MRRSTRALTAAVVLTGLVTGTALAGHGKHRGWGHRGGWGHERREHGWYGPHRRGYFVSGPDVYYAPPPIIYAPAYQPPGINFIFPLRIR